MRKMHASIEAHNTQLGLTIFGGQILENQIENHVQAYQALVNDLMANINGVQRKASRSFAPAVQTRMKPAYDQCAEKEGKGVYLWMRNMVLSQVEMQNEPMFNDAGNAVRLALDSIYDAVGPQMEELAQRVPKSLQRDYETAVSPASTAKLTGLQAKGLKQLKQELMALISSNEGLFLKMYEEQTSSNPTKEMVPEAVIA